MNANKAQRYITDETQDMHSLTMAWGLVHQVIPDVSLFSGMLSVPRTWHWPSVPRGWGTQTPRLFYSLMACLIDGNIQFF